MDDKKIEKQRAKCRKYYERHKPQFAAKHNRFVQRHPLAGVHHGMLTRCGIIKGASKRVLDNYANRGITVCEEWRHLRNFEEWALSNGWAKGLQIDRIDNDKGYSPDNCRFVSARFNSSNHRRTILVTYNGESMSISDAMKKSGCVLNYDTVARRIKFGMDAEQAMTMPLTRKAK